MYCERAALRVSCVRCLRIVEIIYFVLAIIISTAQYGETKKGTCFVIYRRIICAIRLQVQNSYQERLKKKRINKHIGRKKLRDDVRILRDRGLSFAQIAKNLNKRGEKMSKSSVRRQFMWDEKLKEKEYAPTSVQRTMHSRVKGLIRKLYKKDGQRTTAQVITLIEEEFGVTVHSFTDN